jgi:hypothetical protein
MSKLQYDSSELGEELYPMSSSLPLRVHKVYIRVSFSDTLFKMTASPLPQLSCHIMFVLLNSKRQISPVEQELITLLEKLSEPRVTQFLCFLCSGL